VVPTPAAVEEFANQLAALGWASDLLVAGSLATADYVPGVSDLDLVALVTQPVDDARQTALTGLHRRIDDLRQAARAELAGYWTWAARRPWMWLDRTVADLGLTAMARARYTIATGTLLSKTQAIEQVDAPAWLINQLRARRRGEKILSPRVRTALIAWRDARHTVASARVNRD
jgi:hypothetical protein